MIVPQKHYTFSPFPLEANYSSHSSLCSEGPPIHLHPSAAELTNGTAFFSKKSIAKDQRDCLPSVLWLGVLLCPILHTLFIFCDWIPWQTQMGFSALDYHAILAASFPGFFLATYSLFQTSFPQVVVQFFELKLNFNSAHTFCHFMSRGTSQLFLYSVVS